MKPLISVIIPVYNTRKYLQEAVDSILVQKDILHEIIIIDDGSTDGSGELLEKLYEGKNNVEILHTKNQGQGLARNLGLLNAKGDYIYFFDSDDIASPNLFSSFNNTILKYTTLELFCFSGKSFLDENYSRDKIVKQSLLSSDTYKRKITKNCNTGEEAFRLLVKNKAFIPGPPLYIIKKNVLINNNLKFNSIRYEDEEFTHKLFLYTKQTYITNEVLFKRRIREGSTMQSKSKFTDITGYFEIIKTLYELKKLSFISPITKKVLEKKISNFIKMTIEMKASDKFHLTKAQKKSFRNFLTPYIIRNSSLLVYYFRYPTEYKLRKLKQHYLK